MSSDNSLIKESKDVFDCVADENYAQTNYKLKSTRVNYER